MPTQQASKHSTSTIPSNIMPRIALVNMFLGFSLIFISAMAGVFLANDITINFISTPELNNGWNQLLLKSAHGHTNLFGLIHICFALTLPYNGLQKKNKILTIGLTLGSIAMSLGMYCKAFSQPSTDIQFLDLIIGVFLFCWMMAIVSHLYGLLKKITR